LSSQFLAAMPNAIARQRDILTAMLHVVELEPALRWFELGCSLGRSAGDELSDIDCGVGVADDRWPEALDLGARLAAAGGPISDTMQQAFPGRGDEHGWHLFTLYTDGAQLSLVLMPATRRAGLPPGSVALYDADARLATPMRPPTSTRRRCGNGPRSAGSPSATWRNTSIAAPCGRRTRGSMRRAERSSNCGRRAARSTFLGTG
jgi:hypothetical protein